MSILVNPHWSRWKGNTSVVHLFSKNKEVCDYTGQLSIKYVVDGSVFWRTPTGTHSTQSGQFLVLNDGQTYSTRIHSEFPVEVVSVHFERRLYADAESSMHLATIEPEVIEQTEHIERVYGCEEAVLRTLQPLVAVARFGTSSGMALEQAVLDLACAMVSLGERERKHCSSVQALRQATREEIYRRLCSARDYICAFHYRQLTIKEIAQASALSQTHLYRHFSSAFGTTPYQFVTSLRIDRAKALLKSTDDSVQAICESCGFESPATFSSLFKRWTGLSPKSWRTQAKLVGFNKRGLP